MTAWVFEARPCTIAETSVNHLIFLLGSSMHQPIQIFLKSLCTDYERQKNGIMSIENLTSDLKEYRTMAQARNKWLCELGVQCKFNV